MFGNMFAWIGRLFPRASRTQRRRQVAQKRHCVRLHLEGLEERVVPATFNPTDAVSLQSAFVYANSNPTEQVIINLTAGDTYNLNDIGTQLADQSTAGITLNGNGATVVAAADNRVIEVDAGAQLVLNNLTVTGGNVTAATAQGGGIADFGGGLTLSSVNITNNTVQGSSSAQGGGIYLSGGSLTLNNSNVSNNRAVGGDATGTAGNSGGSAEGGGLYVNGSGWNVIITGSTLADNSALGGLGGTGAAGSPGGDGGDAYGGGISINGSGNGLEILSTSFSSNAAQGGVGGQGGTSGSTSGTISGTISGNDAVPTGIPLTFSGTLGGGLSGSFTFSTNSSIFNGSGIVNGVSYTFNGVFNDDVTDTTGVVNGIHTDTISGSITFSGTTSDGRPVSGSSNYIFTIDSRTANVLSGTFSGSINATLSGGAGGTGGLAQGGAVADFSSTPLSIQQSSFGANSALGGTGGSGGSPSGSGGNGGNGSGGGLYLSASSPATLLNSSVTNNNATGGNGGSGVASPSISAGDSYGGGIANYSSDLTLINTTVGGNTAQGGNVAGTSGAAGNAYGGGLYDMNAASLINDTLAFNAAAAGSGGQTAATAQGGGIYAPGSPTLTNVILQSNSATTGSDFYGAVGTSSSYDFISNTSDISNASALSSLSGMILNSQTPQLDTLTEDPGGLAYYPLLAGSASIGTGTTSVVNTIAAAEGVDPANATDEIGNPRVVNNSITMGAIEEGYGSDIYTWDPTQVGSDGNYLASDPQNWLLNGQEQTSQGTTPGYKSTDIAQFDGDISNAPIEWNQDFTFSTMVLGPQGGGSYTGQQTIDMGDTVELTGIDVGGSSVSMDDGSSLNVAFGSSTPSMPLDGAAKAPSTAIPAVVVDPVLKLDGGSTWDHFDFTGDPMAQVIFNGGTTRMGLEATDTANVGVQLVINKGATLRDLGFIPLTLTASNLVIKVNGGEMDAYFGTGNGITLVQLGKDAQGDYFTGCYFDVNGGTLKYIGIAGRKDTFAIPVLVENSGTFSVTTTTGSSGGWLIVTGQVQQTQKDSVYVKDRGGVSLSNSTTLECDEDYRQDGGNLSTSDNTKCTLQDGQNGKGTAVIAGGIVQIAAKSKDYGELDVNCSTLDFAGEYIPRIDGGAANKQDLLKVNGTMSIDQTKAMLSVTIVGDPKKNLQWTIINATNNLQRFPINNLAGTGLTEQGTTTYVLKS
ncbi:MAG TPA: hypothetical protein VH682_15655 [Gemmataceae bacterium]